MRVAFAGTPAFAEAALAALHAAGFDVPLVLTQPDRPAGRGMKLQASPVKALAQRLGIPLAQPRSLRLDGKYAGDAEQAQAALNEARPDAMVVAAYGLLLPPWTLELPQLGCINIHASLLPRWRGAAPIHRAIEAGDAETGVTIMQMDAGLDTGDILMREPLAIEAGDTTASLHDRLAALGARLVVDALRAGERGEWRAEPQPADGITYASKIDKAESRIDWTQAAEVVERRVRAFDPFPGAGFAWRGEAVKLWRAQVRPDVAGAAGRVVAIEDGQPVVACGRGGLLLQQLQRPGGKRQPAQAVTASLGIAPGATLGD